MDVDHDKRYKIKSHSLEKIPLPVKRRAFLYMRTLESASQANVFFPHIGMFVREFCVFLLLQQSSRGTNPAPKQ